MRLSQFPILDSLNLKQSQVIPDMGMKPVGQHIVSSHTFETQPKIN